MVALGPHTAGVMSNDEPLATAWLEAAKTAGEDMWRLPLTDRLREQLKSDVADMKNTGERWGGAITAGLFLREFVGEVPWVHVDIAGPSTADKESGEVSKGGTGFAVATIVEYVKQPCVVLSATNVQYTARVPRLDCSDIGVVEFARLGQRGFFFAQQAIFCPRGQLFTTRRTGIWSRLSAWVT